MKRITYTNLYLSIAIALFFIFLYMQNSSSLQKFNNNFIDSYFNVRGEENASKDIIIIDVDERSLAALGHWPWRRDKIARIVDNLTGLGIGILGFDMVFAEEDESSPDKVAKALEIEIPDAVNYDKLFANAIASSPSILGYVLNMEENFTNVLPNVNAMFVEKNRPQTGYYIPHAKGVTANIPLLQESAYSSGSFNMFPDDDGVVRSVPMVFELDGMIYPSLSLEMVRVALGVKRVDIIYNDFGIDHIQIGELTIPTDKNGRVFVDFRGPKYSYRYISALDIYEGKVKKEAIEGKIALFGTSASGLLDLRAIPFDQSIPGVEIHANVLDNILANHFLQKPSNVEGINMLLIFFATLLIGMILSLSLAWLQLLFSITFIALLQWGLYSLMFKEGIVLDIVYVTLSMLTTMVILFFVNFFHQQAQKEKILGKFAKKVSPAVAETLIKAGNVDFKADDREVTIFFSDVRNFTTISEGFENPHDLIDYLNRYMSPMSDIIIKESGTIDKYIGDAIMAYWNAPLEVQNHADCAVTSALKQFEALKSLNVEFKRDQLPLVEIGIGIHTGGAVVGEMGSHDRSDYTIIGDSINLGSRVEGLCKTYGVNLLITEATKKRLTKVYKIREVDRVIVKGKQQAVTLYTVLGFGAFEGKEIVREEAYNKALNCYKRAQYKEAKEQFDTLYHIYHDSLFARYHDRCDRFIKEGIILKDGVFKHAEK